MKALKVIIIVVVILVAAFLILAAIAPKTYNVARSISIDAPMELVYEQISKLENIQAWSPWKDYDSEMKTTIEGTDGTVGAVASWVGNEAVGKGTQTLTRLKQNEIVEMEVSFIEPWEETSKTVYTITVDTAGLNVTWELFGGQSYPKNIYLLFMSMDEAVGKDFENGLGKLKELCEKLASENSVYRGYEINEIEYGPKTFVAIRDTVAFADMQTFFNESFGKIMQAVEKNKLQMTGPPCGLYYMWDMEKNISHAGAAVPVQTEGELKLKDLELLDVTGKALFLQYKGSYEQSGEAHYAMDDYIKAKELKQLAPVIEEYITDPTQEPDTSKWLTNIYYIVE